MGQCMPFAIRPFDIVWAVWISIASTWSMNIEHIKCISARISIILFNCMVCLAHTHTHDVPSYARTVSANTSAFAVHTMTARRQRRKNDNKHPNTRITTVCSFSMSVTASIREYELRACAYPQTPSKVHTHEQINACCAVRLRKTHCCYGKATPKVTFHHRRCIDIAHCNAIPNNNFIQYKISFVTYQLSGIHREEKRKTTEK